jgi:hypothetical protein
MVAPVAAIPRLNLGSILLSAPPVQLPAKPQLLLDAFVRPQQRFISTTPKASLKSDSTTRALTSVAQPEADKEKGYRRVLFGIVGVRSLCWKPWQN